MKTPILKILFAMISLFLLAATSCGHSNYYGLRFELKSCPHEAFILPYSIRNEDLEANIFWLEDSSPSYQLKFSKQQSFLDRIDAFFSKKSTCSINVGASVFFRNDSQLSDNEKNERLKKIFFEAESFVRAIAKTSSLDLTATGPTIYSFKDHDEYTNWLKDGT